MIIAVANQKGGVGKTTTVVNLGHLFARRGYRVLIVDFDVQGHAATCLGQPKGNGLFRLLVEEAAVQAAAIPARDGLDLITSNKLTEKIRVYLNDVPFRELYISQALEGATQEYDLILLDLAPGSDILHVGALVASDYLIVPARMDFLALDGVMEIIKTARSLARIPSVAAPELIGVLPTMFERTTNETMANLERLQEAIGADAVLPPIPNATVMREATSRGMTIWEYAPESPIAIGYRGKAQAMNGQGRIGGYLHLGEIVERLVF